MVVDMMKVSGVILGILLVSCLLLWAVACDVTYGSSASTSSVVPEGGEPLPAQGDPLPDLGEQVVMPLVEGFERTAAELSRAAASFCDAPTQESLLQAQEAWQEARGSWKQVEVLPPDPVRASPERLVLVIDLWPVREDRVLEGLQDDAIDLTQIASLRAYMRGLPVVEYLLYAPAQGHDTVLASFTDVGGGARRCQYLVAASSDVSRSARLLREAWDPREGDFLGEWSEAGQGSVTFESLELGVGEVLGAMTSLCEEMEYAKLMRPLGRNPDGVVMPDEVESRFSARSLDDIRDNLVGIEALFHGRYQGRQAESWQRYLASKGAGFGERFDVLVSNVRVALDQVDGSLSDAIVEDPEAVEVVVEAIKALRVFLRVDVVDATGAVIDDFSCDCD